MSALPDKETGIRLTEQEKALRARRSRAIGLSIAALCALFYLITVLKMGPDILKRVM